MDTEVSEIADRIYRLSTFVPAAGPAGLGFNLFLIDADEPLLFHCGQRALFPSVIAAARRVVALERLRWITFSHVEADECGALEHWLAAAPGAEASHGRRGCAIWLNDMASRPPRPRKDGEVIDLGGKRVHWLETPHLPHNWEAGLLFEEVTGTLFCSDLFTQLGRTAAATSDDIVAPAIATEERMRYLPATADTAPALRRLAALAPKSLALMHGPHFTGDAAAALEELARHYEGRVQQAGEARV
jgi:flavorubredoxin